MNRNEHSLTRMRWPEEFKRRAGLQDEILILSRDSGTPWQKDDEKWFAENPSRTHRLRSVHSRGRSTWPTLRTMIPAGHQLNVLIRQVEPGLRVRYPFFRDNSAPIPDSDAVLAALFNYCAAATSDCSIPAGEIFAAAKLLETAGPNQ